MFGSVKWILQHAAGRRAFRQYLAIGLAIAIGPLAGGGLFDTSFFSPWEIAIGLIIASSLGYFVTVYIFWKAIRIMSNEGVGRDAFERLSEDEQSAVIKSAVRKAL